MVFNSLYLHRYLSDRKVLGHYYYVLVPNRPKITFTDPTDRTGTPITLQVVGRAGRFRPGATWQVFFVIFGVHLKDSLRFMIKGGFSGPEKPTPLTHGNFKDGYFGVLSI